MLSLGIDIGYSSVCLSLSDGKKIIENKYLMHKGNIRGSIITLLLEILNKYKNRKLLYGAITGTAGKKIFKSDFIGYINEVTSLIEGSLVVNRDIKSIIEIGGQSAKFISDFTDSDRSSVKISMNSNCSAGTGSFIEEQVGRLNVNLDDYSKLASKAEFLPRIAGRCSVFAKSDIIHHQQEGISVENLLAGLAYSLVNNYRGVVIKKNRVRIPCLFTGGVAYNKAIGNAFKDIFKIDSKDFITPDNPGNIASSGAAMLAGRKKMKFNIQAMLEYLKKSSDLIFTESDCVKLLPLKQFGNNDAEGKHRYNEHTDKNEITDCFLGIDIGSTSTNLVLTDTNKNVIFYKYLRTLGDPVDAVSRGFKCIKNESEKEFNILGMCTTGSGRYLIGKLAGSDLIKDEITAQARGAFAIDKDVDTVFEIGGQDSKYISLDNGKVKDFQMNKICAAGTGSFIEEQSKKFNIPIEKFSEFALKGSDPVYLGERCTVFIESNVAQHLSAEDKIENICAGLCYSIVKNYLDRVVGQKPVGNRILFQGGLAFNQGVVNAFRSITGKEIYVPRFFSVTGAYGAAVLAQEEKNWSKSKFRGFDHNLKSEFIALKSGRNNIIQKKDKEYMNNSEKIIFHDYDNNIDKKKKSVGIPRALFTYGMFPMFNAFFKKLGLNVILSDPTDENTIKKGQEYSLDEACYPVKLINGHVAELVEQNVDYIFFPDLYNVEHPGSEARKDYGCAYMQLAFKVINQAMDLENRGIKLLAPTIAFSMGKEFMMKSFGKLGNDLGKSNAEIQEALKAGMKALADFEERIEADGKSALAKISPDEKVFVMISKIYGVADPVLNMGIPEKLSEMGYKVIPFYNLPEVDLSEEHPNMFWPFGQHILEPARLVKELPNYYAILLTHHGCGPDSVLTHYFKEIMQDKQYLHIEVDEHSSNVGVRTRIEAFVNSLEKNKITEVLSVEDYKAQIVHKKVNIHTEFNESMGKDKTYIPNLYPYSELVKYNLINQGVNADVLETSDDESVDIGRTFSITEEYFSLTVFLGDIIKTLRTREDNVNFLIPQTEGAEVEGQLNRILRTKLDENGYEKINVIAPYIEDMLFYDKKKLKDLFLCFLAGDVIRMADYKEREELISTTILRIKEQKFNPGFIREMADKVYMLNHRREFNRKILLTGEIFTLYNDRLNDNLFKNLEKKGHKVFYSPLSEYMLFLWNDYLIQNNIDEKTVYRELIIELRELINTVSLCFKETSPFDNDFDDMVCLADNTIGYYSGANGRYRAVKALRGIPSAQGIISAASMYENTAISLNILHRGFKGYKPKPLLNLTFDGNRNDSDQLKVDSFLYYLK